MPAPQPEALGLSAKMNFAARGIALPMQWKSMGPLYPDAFGPPERATPATPPGNLFHEPTANKYHTDAARILGRKFETYIDGICSAIAMAIRKWMQSASVASVTLNGTIGTVAPGAVVGPPLKPVIMAAAPRATRQELRYSQAVATAVNDAWGVWQQGLSGLLNYPPFGPPGPNIPAPLITFGSAGEANLAPERLGAAMFRNLGDPGALHARDLFDSLSRAVYTHFQEFKAATLICGVIMTPPAPPLPQPLVIASLEKPADADTMSALREPAAPEASLETAPPAIVPAAPGGMVIPTPGNFV
jgi:hypothetical protein